MSNAGRMELLSQEQVHKILSSALDILEDTGARVGLDLVELELKKLGCPVVDGVTKFPREVVRHFAEKAPGSFTLYGRDADYVVEINDSTICFQPMIGRLNILDSATNNRRRTTLDDVADLMRIADALPNYQMLHSGAIMPHIDGIDDAVAHVHGYLKSVQSSSKVIKGTCRGTRRAADCIRMAAAVAGGKEALRERPNIFTTYNVISPLEHGKEMLEGLREYAALGLPVDITCEPQMGATSPVTLAGTLAQQTAELLSGVVIAQALRPGTPVFVGTCGAAMDMRYGTIALGGVEAAIINAAHAQIARHLRIPSRGTGGNSDAKILDFQAGYEKALSLLIPALAGTNMIFYPGTIDHAETISPESLLLDHEICSIVYRLLEGVGVSRDTLAVETIKAVGPSGHFLNARHTLDYLLKEHHSPQFADRRRRADWEESGSRDVVATAREGVKSILANHWPKPLPADTEGRLQQIVAEVEQRELGRAGNR